MRENCHHRFNSFFQEKIIVLCYRLLPYWYFHHTLQGNHGKLLLEPFFTLELKAFCQKVQTWVHRSSLAYSPSHQQWWLIEFGRIVGSQWVAWRRFGLLCLLSYQKIILLMSWIKDKYCNRKLSELSMLYLLVLASSKINIERITLEYSFDLCILNKIIGRIKITNNKNLRIILQ